MLLSRRPSAQSTASTFRPTRRHWLRTLIGTGLAATLAATTLAATETPAAAHTKLNPRGSCAGGEVSPHHDLFAGRISIFVYYSSAGGGTNCAWAQKNVNRTRSEYLALTIRRCATGIPTRPCSPTASGTDSGYFRYYAGPVRVTGTAHRCLTFTVTYSPYGTATIPPSHCR